LGAIGGAATAFPPLRTVPISSTKTPELEKLAARDLRMARRTPDHVNFGHPA
jgi:hypothetical protein